MINKWIKDIRIKTKDMDREQAFEYIRNYYWYHILIAGVLLGLLVLVIYHIGWGDRQKDFYCVLVNQRIDFDRDEKIAQDFADISGIREKMISVNSDYQISYPGKELEDINESSYEKFFFNWTAGDVDAVIMPESFYRYCLEQGGEFVDLGEWAEDAGVSAEALIEDGVLYEEQGSFPALYIKKTCLSDFVETETDDPVLLAFPGDSDHERNSRKFFEYVLK